MVFGKGKSVPGVSASRLAAVAGSSIPVGMQDGPRLRAAPPDPKKIRPREVDASPEDRKRRLQAKALNFSATIFARLVIIGAALYWMWNEHQFSGQVHRGVITGVIVMTADIGRVMMKASTPGTR